eukprot:SAG31_NODE_18531_length_632_cov_9.530957_1_plen_72_part_10
MVLMPHARHGILVACTWKYTAVHIQLARLNLVPEGHAESPPPPPPAPPPAQPAPPRPRAPPACVPPRRRGLL